VSSGGTASSYFMGTMRDLNVTTNLRGRHTNPNFIYSLLKKKTIGERQLTPKSLTIKRGIIYLMGDLLGSIISLTRRHYALSHTQLIGGDSEWLQQLHYSNENPNQIVTMYSPLDDKNSNDLLHQISTQLFCIGKEEEGNDLKLYRAGNTPKFSNGLKLNEPLNGNHQVIVDRTLMRVREILAYTGRNKIDPIGIYNHFKQWQNFERKKTEENNENEENVQDKETEVSGEGEEDVKLNKVPILFIMFDDIISSDKKTREAAEKALKKFLQFKNQFTFKDLSDEQKRKVFLAAILHIPYYLYVAYYLFTIIYLLIYHTASLNMI
jgi:hypothetical protein